MIVVYTWEAWCFLKTYHSYKWHLQWYDQLDARYPANKDDKIFAIIISNVINEEFLWTSVPFANYNKMEEKEDFVPVTLMTIRGELFYVCCYARKDIKSCKLFLGFIKSKMLKRDKETKRRSYTF